MMMTLTTLSMLNLLEVVVMMMKMEEKELNLMDHYSRLNFCCETKKTMLLLMMMKTMVD